MPVWDVRRRMRLVRALVLSAVAVAAPALAGPPASFTTTVVASGFDLPTAFAQAPDGRLFVTEKRGVVKVVDGGVVHTFLDIADQTNEYVDRGLLGIALDPAFAASGWVYLYHIEESDPGNPDAPSPAIGTVFRIRASALDANVAVSRDAHGRAHRLRQPPLLALRRLSPLRRAGTSADELRRRVVVRVGRSARRPHLRPEFAEREDRPRRPDDGCRRSRQSVLRRRESDGGAVEGPGTRLPQPVPLRHRAGQRRPLGRRRGLGVLGRGGPRAAGVDQSRPRPELRLALLRGRRGRVRAAGRLRLRRVDRGGVRHHLYARRGGNRRRGDARRVRLQPRRSGR